METAGKETIQEAKLTTTQMEQETRHCQNTTGKRQKCRLDTEARETDTLRKHNNAGKDLTGHGTQGKHKN